MNTFFEKKVEELDLLTNSLLSDLEKLNHKILQIAPDENKWSVMQVLDHLVISETMSLLYIQKKILGIDTVENVGVMSSVRVMILKLSMNGIFRFNAPASLKQPQGNQTLGDIQKKWTESRDRLKVFIDVYPEEYINRAIFKHPISGRISMAQMIYFFKIHLLHHQSQIRRILKVVTVM